MESIKDKALRYRNLAKDETFKELIENVANEQVAVFLDPSSSVEAIDDARAIVVALKNIDRTIQRIFDEESIYDKHNS
jgi:hypothetical protein